MFIGVLSSVDIVCGLVLFIYGLVKIGGYLNFNFKLVKVGCGQYLDEFIGVMLYIIGLWDKNIVIVEVGGLGKVFGKDFGYYIYVEIENLDFYYCNSEIDQIVV